jgi:hypothetical protein
MKRKEPPDGLSKIRRPSTRRRIVPNPLSRTAENSVYSTGRFSMAGIRPQQSSLSNNLTTTSLDSIPTLQSKQLGDLTSPTLPPSTITEPCSTNAVQSSSPRARRIVFPPRSLLNTPVSETTELDGIYFPDCSIPPLHTTGAVTIAASIPSNAVSRKVSPICTVADITINTY